ncbi:winged helix-turn-helix transcriptional regulator [Deinococcus alpinitundrae]|uniref:winged helix-turn-helix transcriptional regulator n=1 Tax=Deinococcus alpinitundrae TaxID=468913 RepID=UPI00137973BB|nr:helix-turn-helix domain-containing protein [Deinococcus alpinitundrae]
MSLPLTDKSQPDHPALGSSPCVGETTPGCLKGKLEVREVLSRVGDKWSLCVVGNLYSGSVRFNELKRRIPGVSQRMLTLTLRGLERDGLVKRTVYPTNPPSVEYALTEMGRTLIEPVRALINWSEANVSQIEGARQRFDSQEGVGTEPKNPAI